MLHTLKLCNVLPEHLYTDTDAYPQLILPKLSRLVMTGSVVSCAILFELLIFPITTNITLECNLDSLWDNSYHRLFRAFLTAIGNEKANFVISALELKINHSILRRSSIGMLYTISHSHQSAPTEVAFKFSLCDYSRNVFQDIFDTASITLPPADAHVLDISGNAPYWPLKFDSLPNIRTIRFMTQYFPQKVVRAALGNKGPSQRLPDLCSLEFFNLKFSDDYTAILMDGLKCRLLSGFPIKKVSLCGCFNLWEADAISMKELVQDIEIDGEKY